VFDAFRAEVEGNGTGSAGNSVGGDGATADKEGEG
jgi:hypothetical protein